MDMVEAIEAELVLDRDHLVEDEDGAEDEVFEDDLLYFDLWGDQWLTSLLIMVRKHDLYPINFSEVFSFFPPMLDCYSSSTQQQLYPMPSVEYPVLQSIHPRSPMCLD